MTAQGRPSCWLAEEDAILRTTAGQSASFVNARLVASGHAARTPAAIKRRRAYLKSTPTAGDPLMQALAQRKELAAELHRREDGTRSLLADLELINAHIKGLLGALDAELSADIENRRVDSEWEER